MSEFERQIDYYLDFWELNYLLNRSEWKTINRSVANAYLEKYWLSASDYQALWAGLKQNIFLTQEHGLPARFLDGFETVIRIGGGLFSEETFAELKDCISQTGESEFVVVENTFYGRLTDPPLNLKFPVDISWKELTSGGYISLILCASTSKEFFVFGDRGTWGLNSASDYIVPMNLIGFKAEVREIFSGKYKMTDDVFQVLAKEMPESDLAFLKLG